MIPHQAIRTLATIQTTLTLMRTLTIVMGLANLDTLANGNCDESLVGGQMARYWRTRKYGYADHSLMPTYSVNISNKGPLQGLRRRKLTKSEGRWKTAS